MEASDSEALEEESLSGGAWARIHGWPGGTVSSTATPFSGTMRNLPAVMHILGKAAFPRGMAGNTFAIAYVINDFT